MDGTSFHRKPLIAANWKMNKTIAETESFIKEFVSKIPEGLDVDVVICPPFTALARARELLAQTKIGVGAQNINENDSGAFTGEISPVMISALGCQYAIIGHSERRQIFKESDELVNKKTMAAFRYKLIPIVCVGETLSEREAGKTLEVVDRQVRKALVNIPSADVQKLLLAYEPVWAIGTGRTATPQQAQEVHFAIRNVLKDQYGSNTSLKVRIIYGGSIKPDNMPELMACEDVDGGLVGGASLTVDSFLKIVNYAPETIKR